MNNQVSWIKTRMRYGWGFVTLGLVIIVIGILAEWQFAYLPFNVRIITGVGILIAGTGVGLLARYRAALKDGLSARRLTAEERDERTVLIRARAGNRAYWVSAALIYIGLMWASFAANGSLPPLDGDTLWVFLAAGVLVPFGVYVASILVDQRKI
jgi:hypothetical protein